MKFHLTFHQHLALFLLLSLPFASIQAQNTAKISGLVKSRVKDVLTIKEYGLPFNFDADKTVTVDTKGHFAAELKMEVGQYYYLIYDRGAQLIFLNPGDDLTATFDGRKMNQSMVYEGAAQAMNDYLRKRLAADKEIQQMVNYGGKKHGLYQLPWADYEKQIRKGRDQLQTLLDDFKQKHGKGKAAKRFVALEQAHIDGTYGLFYLQFPAYHAHFTKANPLDLWKNLELPLMDSLVQNEPDLLYSKNYRDFLNQYALALSEKKFLEQKFVLRSKSEFIKQTYMNIPNVFAKEWQVEYIQGRVLFEQIDQHGLTNMEKVAEDYKGQKIAQPSYQAAVAKAWHKWASTSPGAEAPSIVGKDINGKEVKLSDFKGKLVYVDVWATWCGPCRKEIPELKKAEARFHDKDVVFLSVSIDNNKDKWEQMVREQELGGVQIHIPGGWSAAICKDYSITSIPRFMLIGKEGEIIETRTLRPTQGIDALLNKHL